MFKSKTISPYGVEDKATFRNIDKTLTLYVRSNPASLIVNLKQAQEKLKELNDESDECQRMNAARFFAKAIFGEEQANMLCDFYDEPLAVVSVVGMYFDQQLKKKITKAQKK